MSVISITDEIYARMLGPEGFAALVEKNARARQRSGGLSLDEELQVRTARVEELQRSVVWTRPADSPAAPLPATRKPAWSSQRPTSKYPWTTELRADAPPQGMLHLGGDVIHRISEWVKEFRWEAETGGMLLAHERLRSQGGSVAFATGPGPTSRHSRFRLELSTEEEIRESLGIDSGHLVRIGGWHTHGIRPTPSQIDLDYLASHVRAGNTTYGCVEVLVLPHEWGGIPRFVGWRTRRVGREHFVTEPIRLTDPYGYTDD